MDQPKLTHEARCLIIVAGGVLERRLERLARGIADGRGAAQVVGEDVEAALKVLLREQIPELPPLIEKAVEGFKRRSIKAA